MREIPKISENMKHTLLANFIDEPLKGLGKNIGRSFQGIKKN
jgi:hypothetical protein